MCGIAGAIGTPDVVAEDLAEVFKLSMRHRGPDAAGHKLLTAEAPGDRRVCLVNRRLAILDLSPRAAQPMEDPDTGNWLAYNGEIYNFRSVREEIRTSSGREFRSDSDTEVLLAGYGRWGDRFLDRMAGMFAFAVWDARQQHLLLGRDRLGIKPLYYYEGNGLFLFASEVRTLLATGLVRPRLSRAGVESYLAYGSLQDPLGIIEGVHALLPGHIMRVLPDGSTQPGQRYWNISLASRAERVQQEASLRPLLEQVVQEHLVSDVPVGALLSGGIDSSSVVILMSRALGRRAHTFSVTFGEQEFSEAEYSTLVARQCGTEHTDVRLTVDQAEALIPDALAAMDQPSADGINTYVVCKAVRDAGMKVVLSGQGGDEVFGGYSTFHYARRLSRLKSIRGLPGPGRRFGATLLSVARGRTAGEDKAVEYVLQADNALDAYLVLRRYFSAPSRIALLGGAATTNGALAQGLPTDQYRRLLEESAPLDPVNEVALFETRVYLANTLLRDGDVMSMAHSLELRVPFLDHRLVELLAQVPGSLKVQPGRQKPLLVDAVGADLPEAVYRRPKMGFTLPWSRWLKSGLRTTIEPVLLSRDMAERAGLAPAACRGVWERFLEGRPGYSWSRPWALFVLMDWCRRHSVEVKK